MSTPGSQRQQQGALEAPAPHCPHPPPQPHEPPTTTYKLTSQINSSVQKLVQVNTKQQTEMNIMQTVE